MFDPYDYFDIRHHRAVCPVHGSKDRNLEIKRHKNDDKWVFNCYSHQCHIRDIALAAGFNPSDIFDHKDSTWLPPVHNRNHIANKRPKPKTITIEEKIDATFGPNPCTNLKLKHDDGQLLHLPCDSKRCRDCGPRKQLTMELQLKGSMGELCYIQRIATRKQLDRILSRMVKASQRTNGDFKYQVTGDEQRQYILITNEPCHPEQNRTSLKDWLKRIIHSWLYTDSRIRRSRSIGRLSLVHLRKKIGKVGTSAWRRVSGRRNDPELLVPDTYEELQDMIDDNEILRMIDYERLRQSERYQRERKLAHRGGVW